MLMLFLFLLRAPNLARLAPSGAAPSKPRHHRTGRCRRPGLRPTAGGLLRALKQRVAGSGVRGSAGRGAGGGGADGESEQGGEKRDQHAHGEQRVARRGGYGGEEARGLWSNVKKGVVKMEEAAASDNQMWDISRRRSLGTHRE